MVKEKPIRDTLERVKRLGISLAIFAGVFGTLYASDALATMDLSNSFFRADITWQSILESVTDTLWRTIFAIAAAAFLVGALMFTTGFISEENKSKGKNLMIGALVGMAVVLSAKALLDTAYYFVYGSNPPGGVPASSGSVPGSPGPSP